MTKKQMRNLALVIAFVFITIIVVYPMMFSPEEQPANQPTPELQIEK